MLEFFIMQKCASDGIKDAYKIVSDESRQHSGNLIRTLAENVTWIIMYERFLYLVSHELPTNRENTYRW